MRSKRWWVVYLLVALGAWTVGCSVEIIDGGSLPGGDPGGGNDGGTDGGGGGGSDDGGNGGGGNTRMLRLAAHSTGGNLAVGVDDAGNEYAFRGRQDASGRTKVIEANVLSADGRTLKVSLDDQGRPVNFRSSDNVAADVVYDGSMARVRLTAANGSVTEDTSGLDPAASRELAARRRAAHPASKQAASAQLVDSTLALTVTTGLSNYEEVALSLFVGDLNPTSPLLDVSFREAALDIADVVSVVEVFEVPAVEIFEVITVDEVPDELDRLAGRTFVLFDAEGFCIERTEVASRLSFDAFGALEHEFDRSLVFPDLSLGGSADPGISISYSTGTPINLTPEAVPGFELFVTPVFTGTQVDEIGGITIERRFQVDAGFDAAEFGSAAGAVNRLFDAALVNGRLSPDGSVLDVDLVLIDLADDTAVSTLGRLRYRDQNSPEPPPIFGCEVITGEKVFSTIVCPESVAEGVVMDVFFVPGRENEGRELVLDWIVSDGFGFVLGDPNALQTEVLAVAPGFLEVSLVVSDLSAGDLAYQVYSCGVSVARDLAIPVPEVDLIIDCPVGLNVGEEEVLAVGGADVERLDSFEWFVFGTSDFYFSDPFDTATKVQFYQPGKFEVAFQGFSVLGDELYISCEVFVGGAAFDECAINGWYDDPICDEFCPLRDPACGDEFIDQCAINGWYGDRECDEFCPSPDPDCEGNFVDVCEQGELYGNGSCDLFCPLPDPDCENYDPCEENHWYGDGVCDDFCPEPDSDCVAVEEDDFCAVLGYYDNGRCDEDCPLPDPDCNAEGVDVCAENGWYGDDVCDDFCPQPDPDCG